MKKIPTRLDVSQCCAYIHISNRLIDDSFFYLHGLCNEMQTDGLCAGASC